MKDQVIKFLGDLPKSGSEQFNQALDHFRRTKNHDAGKVRYYNALGFSPDRLASLLYELKKLHNVTDIEVANAKRKSPLTPEGGTKKAAKKAKAAPSEGVLAAPDEAEIVVAEDKIVQISEGDTPEEITDKIQTTPSEEFKKQVADFDLEAEKYNSIKSFAAILSDYLNEDPADQKLATLKAFVAEAKKKLTQS